ncbi:MAG: tetratricopeptide repeat protein [Acidobacteriota bacterium]
MNRQCLCLLVLLLASVTTSYAQVAQGPQRVESLVNIDLRTDIRVFTVMAALNVAGFDYQVPGQEMSAVRQSLRRDLEAQRLDVLLVSRLKNFFSDHLNRRQESEQHVPYISLALVLSGPPEFEITVPTEDLPEDAVQVLGFEDLVKEFYRAARIDSLWKTYRHQYLEELAAYRPVFMEVIQETLKYFRIPPRIVLDRQIILMPDLLGVRDLVNARNLEDTYYVVTGPAEDPADNYAQLQHEYLHFLVDPLVEKFGAAVLANDDLMKLAQSQPAIKSDYQNNYLLVIKESLIESIMMKMHPEEDLDRKKVELYRQGLIFMPYFERSLKLYEQSDLLSFPAYSETLFHGIDEKIIEQDEREIARLENEFFQHQRAEREAAEQRRQAMVRRMQIRDMLVEAEGLIAQQSYESAEAKLNEVLREEPGNGNALFYLAQVASQQREYSPALQYYERASQAPGLDVWIKALSLLRMGNIFAFQGELAQARVRFEQVLALEGDLRGAREEAREAIEGLTADN